MLLAYFEVLKGKRIVLGSQSKSRNSLLATQLPKYQICPSKFEENLDKASFPSAREYNVATCKGKVEDLLKTFKAESRPWDILICCDTIVELKGQIIEKPENKEQCIKMMSGLCNQWHKVYTAHQLVFNTPDLLTKSFVIDAEVLFGDVPMESLEKYSETEIPYLHSGGYELFGVSGSFIEEIKGSLTAVQGVDTYQLSLNLISGMRQLGWI